MPDYILLMHADARHDAPAELWPAYFAILRERGAFQGGSAIGGGAMARKDGNAAPPLSPLVGYIRIQTTDMAAARALVAENPVFKCGGSVEIRELAADGPPARD